MKKFIISSFLLLNLICSMYAVTAKYKIITSTKPSSIGYQITGSQAYSISKDTATPPTVFISSYAITASSGVAIAFSNVHSSSFTFDDGTYISSNPYRYGGGGGGGVETSTFTIAVFTSGNDGIELYVSSLTPIGLGCYMPMSSTVTITEVGGWLMYPSTCAPIVCDIHYMTAASSTVHTSIWNTTQANRLTFATSSYFATPITTFDTPTIPKGGLLTLHIDQTGNTNGNGAITNAGASAGMGLSVYIKGYRSLVGGN